jgi:hypothetical protein
VHGQTILLGDGSSPKVLPAESPDFHHFVRHPTPPFSVLLELSVSGDGFGSIRAA